MNGYQLTKQYFAFAAANPGATTPGMCALFMWLVEVNNRSRFTQNFFFNAEDAGYACGMQSRKTVWKYLVQLEAAGLVRVVYKSNNQERPSVLSLWVEAGGLRAEAGRMVTEDEGLRCEAGGMRSVVGDLGIDVGLLRTEVGGLNTVACGGLPDDGGMQYGVGELRNEARDLVAEQTGEALQNGCPVAGIDVHTLCSNAPASGIGAIIVTQLNNSIHDRLSVSDDVKQLNFSEDISADNTVDSPFPKKKRAGKKGARSKPASTLKLHHATRPQLAFRHTQTTTPPTSLPGTSPASTFTPPTSVHTPHYSALTPPTSDPTSPTKSLIPLTSDHTPPSSNTTKARNGPPPKQRGNTASPALAHSYKGLNYSNQKNGVNGARMGFGAVEEPDLSEVSRFFTEHGYTAGAAAKAWAHYRQANWHDVQGRPVLNWQQKCRTIWFTPENRIIATQSRFVQ